MLDCDDYICAAGQRDALAGLVIAVATYHLAGDWTGIARHGLAAMTTGTSAWCTKCSATPPTGRRCYRQPRNREFPDMQDHDMICAVTNETSDQVDRSANMPGRLAESKINS
jgi:hypothetical protein